MRLRVSRDPGLRHLQILAVAAALPVVLFAIVVVVLFSRQQQQNVQAQLTQLARSAANAADLILANRIATMEGMAALAASGETAGIRVQAQRLLEQDNDWLAIAIHEGPDTTLFQRHDGPDLHSVLESGDFSVPEARQPIGSLFTKVETNEGSEPVFLIQNRRSDPAGPVVVAALDPGPFSQALSELRVTPGWTAAILDPSYTIVGRSRAPEEFVGTKATPSLQEALRASRAGFFYALNKEGDTVYTAFVTSPETGWTAAVGAPEAIATAPVRNARLALIGGGAISVVLAAALAWVLISNIGRRHAAERSAIRAEGDRQAERRLSEIAANFPGVIYRRVLHRDGTISYPYLSDGIERILGTRDTPSHRSSLEDIAAAYVAPEDRQKWKEAIAASAQNLSDYEIEGRVIRPDGETRWLHSVATAHRDADGAIVWDGVMLDVTELKATEHALRAEIVERERVEQHQALLLSELNHRVRNTLAVVLSIAQQTLKRSDSLDSFNSAFIGRVSALAQVHTLLSESSWTATSLRALAERAVAPHLQADRNVSISGPDLLVPPGPAVTLSLIFHELATNAAKYGSLSVPAGSLEITWSIDEDEVHLRWAERNGPAPSKPARSGFGTQLIEASVTRELEGRWSVEFGAEGLTCEVVVPTALLTGNAGQGQRRRQLSESEDVGGWRTEPSPLLLFRPVKVNRSGTIVKLTLR